jgi:hypothetical protein
MGRTNPLDGGDLVAALRAARIRDLGTGRGLGINASGDVVGQSCNAAGDCRAFIRDLHARGHDWSPSASPTQHPRCSI